MPTRPRLVFGKADKAVFPCPTCGRGWLQLDPSSIREDETAATRRGRLLSDEWEPDYHQGRFVAVLICDRKGCEEHAVAAGRSTVSPEYQDDPDGGPPNMDYELQLAPEYISPAPRFFNVPKACSKGVASELDRAFGAFWFDNGACANAIRRAVEHFLTDQGVARFTQTRRFINLHQRIERWGRDPKRKELSEALLAVKWIGNPGSHAGAPPLRREDLYDGFDLLEHVIHEVMVHEPRRAQTQRLARTINRKKRPRSHAKG